MTKVTIDRALIEQAIEALHFGECMYPNGGTALMIIKAAKESMESALTSAPQCNLHPKAPHGFNRNGSHSAGRYVCDCEGWEPYDAGFNDGFQSALSQDSLAEPVSDDLRDRLVAISAAIADQDDCAAQAMIREILSAPPPPAEPAVEPVAVHQVKLDARRWRDIAKDEMQNYIAKGFWETRTLYTSPPPPAESAKPPGMAVQALAGEIVAALLADEKDGGYDLTAGMFGPAFSVLVRRWAAAEWNSPPAEPARTSQDVCTVPLLSNKEIHNADPHPHIMFDTQRVEFARAIEQLVRRKAGL